MTLEYNRQEASQLDARYAELVQKLNHLESSLEELRFKNEDRKQQVHAELEQLRYENDVYAGELDYWERVQRVRLDAEIQAYRSLLNFQLKLLQNGASSDINISSTGGSIGLATLGSIGFLNGGSSGNYNSSNNNGLGGNLAGLSGGGNFNSNYHSSLIGGADRNNNSHYLNGASGGNYSTVGELISRPIGASGGNYTAVGELISRPIGLDSNRHTLSGGVNGGAGANAGLSINYNGGASAHYNGLGASNNPNFANSSRIQASSREQNYVLTPTGGVSAAGAGGGNNSLNATATHLVNQAINNATHGMAHGNQPDHHTSSSLIQGGSSGASGTIGAGGANGGRVTGTLSTAGGVSTVTTTVVGSGGLASAHHQQASTGFQGGHPMIATTTVANNITQTSASSSIVRGANNLEDKSHFADRSKSDTIAGFF
jgi:hypothetical protein